MEKDSDEYVIAVVKTRDFGRLRQLARKMGFRTKFQKHAPSRARGVKTNPNMMYAKFIRKGE